MATDINGQHFGDYQVVYDNNWKFRNSAITGTTQSSYHELVCGVEDPDGVGVIDNVYLNGGGIYVHPTHHFGTLYVKNLYVTQAKNNALYSDETTADTASHWGNPGGGTVHVGNCYFVDNNISHVRLNAGSSVQNTVIHNTNNVPDHPNGLNSRGLHTFYGYGSEWGYDTVEAKNLHVKVTDGNTNGAASAFDVHDRGHYTENPVWNIRDSEIVGPKRDMVNYNPTNVGSNPTLTVPSGVPTSPQEATSGNNDGSPGLPGGDFGADYTPPSEAVTGGVEDLTVRPE
jgi:hypothetical protein